jgi:hypothetical protein
MAGDANALFASIISTQIQPGLQHRRPPATSTTAATMTEDQKRKQDRRGPPGKKPKFNVRPRHRAPMSAARQLGS